jgi:hypothetical protein
MWKNEVLEEIYGIREEHAKAFNYDMKANTARLTIFFVIYLRYTTIKDNFVNVNAHRAVLI